MNKDFQRFIINLGTNFSKFYNSFNASKIAKLFFIHKIGYMHAKIIFSYTFKKNYFQT